MIFAALNQYYDRLSASPDTITGRPKIPDYGFSEEKIGYILIISNEGRLLDIVNHLHNVGKKTLPKTMYVPRPVKRTSGIQPNYLWDKSAYVLGVIANPDKKAAVETPWLTTPDTFEAFKKYHIDLFKESHDEGLLALLDFLHQWHPEFIDQPPCSHDLLNASIAFQLDGDRCYIHDRPEAKKIWLETLDATSDGNKSNCLVSGKLAKISRLHPSIKGVYGGQSSGGSIVSFNAESYESYGKKQGDNAPVSEQAAFKYTAALNYLLKRENRHSLSIADASTVFWAITTDSNQAKKVELLFDQIVNPTDDGEATQIKPLIEQIAKGQPLEKIAPDIDPDTHFYLLGLAPNAARISIRFWLESRFGELAKHISEHFTDLALAPLPWDKPPSIWRLLIELVPFRSGKKANSKEIPSNLAGEMMRAILTGAPYPQSLLAQLALRIRSDGHISPLRVAMIKAVLNRNNRKSQNTIKEIIPMSLDKNNDNTAYLLGRLFAVLERIQSSAIKNANATIADRYFASASTVPYSVFPRLLASSKNHLAKIRKDKPGYAVNLDKDITSIIGKLPAKFPKHFSIENQGKFTIGYYQQREKYFTSKDNDSKNNTAETN